MTGKIDWKVREHSRMTAGKYKVVPWVGEPWVAKEGPLAEHFVHVSERDPSMLAYTPSASDGERDRRVPIKPGRYLQKFYSDRLTAEQVKHYASMVRGNGLKIEFTENLDVIRRIYASSGMTACMSHNATHYTACRYNGGVHPVGAYLGGDLRLAFSRNAAWDITGRALVWPEKKLFTRCYGDHEALKKALEADGFTYGLPDGARLKPIPLEAREFTPPPCKMPYLTAPYVDHVKWARYENVDGKITFRLQVKATGATHSVQHGDGIGYPISVAPQRPAGMTGISIAAEHAQLVAIEAGKTPAPAEPSKARALDIGLLRPRRYGEYGNQRPPAPQAGQQQIDAYMDALARAVEGGGQQAAQNNAGAAGVGPAPDWWDNIRLQPPAPRPLRQDFTVQVLNHLIDDINGRR